MTHQREAVAWGIVLAAFAVGTLILLWSMVP
jgi:hypothetical protein